MKLNMEKLVIKAQEGDKEAFTQAILLIKNDLYKISKMKTTNEEDIQDIIQETMLDAYKYLKKLKEPKKFKAWIIKILINNCNKYYRKKYKDNEIYANIGDFIQIHAMRKLYKEIGIKNEAGLF